MTAFISFGRRFPTGFFHRQHKLTTLRNILPGKKKIIINCRNNVTSTFKDWSLHWSWKRKVNVSMKYWCCVLGLYSQAVWLVKPTNTNGLHKFLHYMFWQKIFQRQDCLQFSAAGRNCRIFTVNISPKTEHKIRVGQII